MEDRDPVGRVEALLDELESMPEPAARELALETVQALLELYGAGLKRIMGRLAGPQAMALADDELVEHLLLLHGLHPVSVEERVRAALDDVRPYLGSHGGDVELLGVSEGTATVRMRGSCEGCPASAMTLKLAIEDAVLKAAPDVERVEAQDDGGGPQPAVGSPLLQIEIAAPRATDAAWTTAGSLRQLSRGAVLLREVAGDVILLLRVQDGTPYAYRAECPGCGGAIADAALEMDGPVGAHLACPHCRRRYDVVRAGRCPDEPQLHLEPVPLLADDDGLIRVAVQAGVA